MYRMIKASNSSKFEKYDAEDWAEYLTEQLDLDEDDSDMLLHDINNLRGDEWIYTLYYNKFPDEVIEAYENFVDYTA